MGVIVVGVDHSAEAKAALRFALEEARFRQARLLAVHAIGSFGSHRPLEWGDVRQCPAAGRGTARERDSRRGW